jgi:hypothetical protein
MKPFRTSRRFGYSSPQRRSTYDADIAMELAAELRQSSHESHLKPSHVIS